MGILENRADSHSELFAARPALVKPLACRTLAGGFWGQFIGHVGLAMRAIGTVRPEQGFQQFAGFVIV